MNKYYFVFLHGQQEPIPVMGESHNVFDGVLVIHNKDEQTIGYFPKDNWNGFTVEHVDLEDMEEEETALPSFGTISNHGH